jgi:hypothetical protein
LKKDVTGNAVFDPFSPGERGLNQEVADVRPKERWEQLGAVHVGTVGSLGG